MLDKSFRHKFLMSKLEQQLSLTRRRLYAEADAPPERPAPRPPLPPHIIETRFIVTPECGEGPKAKRRGPTKGSGGRPPKSDENVSARTLSRRKQKGTTK